MEVTFPTVIVSLLLTVLLTTLIFFKWRFSYWKNRNIFYVEPKIPFGNLQNPFTMHTYIGILFKNLYMEAKAHKRKHAGLYYVSAAKYFPIDPQIIKNIVQKDFNYFTERGFYFNEKGDPLSANLFALGGEKWRSIRTSLSPAFTSGKLKMMFEILVQCGYQLRDAMQNFYENKQEIDLKELSVRYSIDVIGSCAFGLECNSFKNPNSEFRQHARCIFGFESVYRRVKTMFAFWWPELARKLNVKLFEEQSDFFINLVRDTIKFRKTNNVLRNDMIQILMDLKSESEINELVLYRTKALEELAAQVFIFFAAGFETSSTTLSYCLYELAHNFEIQEKVRMEIEAVLQEYKGAITYDAVLDMKYMGQVLDEVLRKYPPVSFITRVCVKDYKIPDTELTVNEGMEVIIPILGLHHDPDYYPDPEKFDPERFSDANKKERVPFTYFPFGEGPRICIGLRFAIMEIKVALAVLLTKYKFSLNKKTKVPLDFVGNSFTLQPKNGIFLNIKRLAEDD